MFIGGRRMSVDMVFAKTRPETLSPLIQGITRRRAVAFLQKKPAWPPFRKNL